MTLKGQAKIMMAESIEVPNGHGSTKTISMRKSNILLLKFSELDREAVVKFLKKFFAVKGWEEKHITVTLESEKRKRSLEQNNLYWALVGILGWAVYQEHGYEDEIHEELLYLYSPRTTAKMTKASVPKRSKDLTVEEFSHLIMGAFYQISCAGVTNVTTSADIRKYWSSWYSWRGTIQKDPLEIANEEEYRKTVPFCEACMTFLDYEGENYIGHLAHVVSKGSGGPSESWNLFHFCSKCHTQIQHLKGWEELISLYPHIAWKVNRARAAEGKSPLEESVKADPVKQIEEVETIEEKAEEKIEEPVKEKQREPRKVLLFHPESNSVHIGMDTETETSPELVVACSADNPDTVMFCVTDLMKENSITKENAQEIADELGVALEKYDLGMF